MNCFHSISFPSEWGQYRKGARERPKYKVSIQLVSPASGDPRWYGDSRGDSYPVSIQLVSPASGDSSKFYIVAWYSTVSIQLVSPASGDTILLLL